MRNHEMIEKSEEISSLFSLLRIDFVFASLR